MRGLNKETQSPTFFTREEVAVVVASGYEIEFILEKGSTISTALGKSAYVDAQGLGIENFIEHVLSIAESELKSAYNPSNLMTEL